uniref:Uncharacterized protein n=1 Tax=Stomoxys calcitrans TaxID=35570 RepID=A0A1I8P705_STOCA
MGCDIKQLLKEWKLENILPHLLAEKIDAEILEMIKLHHIRMLLHNFPLGIQIRFEHNLEEWRYNIGKPLYAHKCCVETNQFMGNQSYSCNVTSKGYKENAVNSTQQNLAQKGVPHIKNVTEHTEESPEHDSNNALLIPISNNTPPETPNTNHSLESASECQAKSSIASDSNASTEIVKQQLCIYTPRPYCPVPKVNLREILLNSKPEGTHLLKIYNSRKSFNRAERRILVNVIVMYYMRNELRFDLQTSYALEAAILKMFPTERLEMYRKSKRGSLYSKYMNAKTAIFSSHKTRTSKLSKAPSADDNEDTIDGSDVDTLNANELKGTTIPNMVEPTVRNATLDTQSDEFDLAQEFLDILEDDNENTKSNLIRPKVEAEVDSDISIQTAYRLHREIIVIRSPFSYKEFLEQACNAYSIPNIEDHYLTVNDCEISEMEFRRVIIQYYKLPTFFVEIKQKSSLPNQLNFDDNEDEVASTKVATIQIATDYLPSAEEILNLPALLPTVAGMNLGKPLENRHRSNIANAVMDECLSMQPNRALKRQDFLILAQNICQAFPNEEESTYFVPSQPKNPARGKLWCAYNKKRNFLLHNGMANRRFPKTQHKKDFHIEQDADQSEADEEDSIDFSENTTMDLDYLMVKWSETFEHRCLELKEEKLTPYEYMERYSILRTPLGTTLMEIDVHNRYPKALTIHNWMKLNERVIEKAKKIKRKCQPLTEILKSIEGSKAENYRAALSLLLIPYILPHNGRKSELTSWRASKLEIQQRFIKDYKSLDELREEPKPTDLQIRFVHSHPQIIYSEFGISGFIFPFSNLLESLNSLFHYMIAMNIEYPKSCNHVWQFVQCAIFDIKEIGNKLSCVDSTLKDLLLAN